MFMCIPINYPRQRMWYVVHRFDYYSNVKYREIVYIFSCINNTMLRLCIWKRLVSTIFVKIVYMCVYMNVQVLLMCVYVQTYRSKVSSV